MFQRSLIASLFFAMAATALAQPESLYPFITVRVEEGDTMPTILMPEKRIEGYMSAKARRQAQRYDKLMRNVIKVYPYARVSAQLLDQYSSELASIQKERDRDIYFKIAEAELRAEFEGDITDMTISQGRVLIKLIDRQTGRTSYDLVAQLRGGFEALIWQGVAKLFGNDLKDDYDALGEDAMIESIVQRIENGELVVADRGVRTAKAQARLEERKAKLYKRQGLPLPSTSMN